MNNQQLNVIMNVIIGVFMFGMCLLIFGSSIESKPKPKVNVEMRFKRGQSINIDINGERKHISLDDFVLEVTP